MTHDPPVEKLCHRCIRKPFRGHSLDGRLARGYSNDLQTCDDCGCEEYVCLFRPPSAVCAACRNVIHVEPAECRYDACTNTYCIVCAPRFLRARDAGVCVPCVNRLAKVPLAFFGEERRSA